MTKAGRKRLETALAGYLCRVEACRAAAAGEEVAGVGWDSVEGLAQKTVDGVLSAEERVVVRSALALAYRNAWWLGREGEAMALRRMIKEVPA